MEFVMKELTKLFWSASLDQMKRGYIWDSPAEAYICLICGERFDQGRIYPSGEAWYEAEKAVQIHIAREHGSIFRFLVELDKRYTGLTEHQKELLSYFYQGASDKQIATAMENGNTSTVRNQRFTFREKAKQAKVFLAIMELLEERPPGEANHPGQLIDLPGSGVRRDERFAITAPENAAILKTYFSQGTDGPLSGFPRKEKRKIAILGQLIRRFIPGRQYSEPEVNEILKAAWDDFVTLRRYLIEYGFMDRVPDGSKYWVKE
jgi:hypothetical protein